jgi:SAM-dependent methyltransferase
MIGIILYKQSVSLARQEGFVQGDKYILKENQNAYDDFYAQIYDDLMLPDKKSEYEVSKIIEMTEPSRYYSSFLDVGSGTGDMVNILKKNGYKACGIDKSSAMIAKSQYKFPDASMKCGDVLDPITFDRGTFSHITCTGFTIYEIENKSLFFQNCYFWLQQNGYLILHLVDKDTFDPIIPAGKPKVLDSPQKYSKKRITDTLIDFMDFTYKSTYDFSKLDGRVTHKETFTDTKTQHIRENEQTLFMRNIEDVLSTAMKYGFIVKGKIVMGEYENSNNEDMDTPSQFLYILERIM